MRLRRPAPPHPRVPPPHRHHLTWTPVALTVQIAARDGRPDTLTHSSRDARRTSTIG
jgi:hypothetical protein